jgi:hypothetical protein
MRKCDVRYVWLYMYLAPKSVARLLWKNEIPPALQERLTYEEHVVHVFCTTVECNDSDYNDEGKTDDCNQNIFFTADRRIKMKYVTRNHISANNIHPYADSRQDMVSFSRLIAFLMGNYNAPKLQGIKEVTISELDAKFEGRRRSIQK